eukprot:COSAG05_NODE_466_length_9533_cov_5.547806_5_plen_161_part_00
MQFQIQLTISDNYAKDMFYTQALPAVLGTGVDVGTKVSVAVVAGSNTGDAAIAPSLNLPQFWPQNARTHVQQPAPARGWLPARLPGRQPARAHASIRNRLAHPGRCQNSDRACTQSVGFMHARLDGLPRMRWNGLDCKDAAGRSIDLRNLLRANSSARTS